MAHIMENEMETSLVDWGCIGIMENQGSGFRV